MGVIYLLKCDTFYLMLSPGTYVTSVMSALLHPAIVQMQDHIQESFVSYIFSLWFTRLPFTRIFFSNRIFSLLERFTQKMLIFGVSYILCNNLFVFFLFYILK